jgi:hypothetical protein
LQLLYQKLKCLRKGKNKMKNKKTLDKLENKVPKSKNVEVENTYATGGVEIEMTKPNESQTVEVKGMKRVLSTKNKTATWY